MSITQDTLNTGKLDYSRQLKQLFNTLKVAENTNGADSVISILNKIGSIYNMTSNYPEALDTYLKLLKFAENKKNKNGIAAAYGNLGNIYTVLKNYEKALEYYSNAIQLCNELKDSRKAAVYLASIGNIYWNLADFSSALEYHLKALAIDEELKNEAEISREYTNIGAIYGELATNKQKYSSSQIDSLYKMALGYYFKTLAIVPKSPSGYKARAVALGNIGAVYTEQKKFTEAEKYLLEAVSIFENLGARDYICYFNKNLSDLYEQTNKSKKALEYYKKHIELRDSIFNVETTKKIVQAEMNFDFEKKQAIEKTKQEKQNALAEETIKRQKQQRNFFIISFLFVIGLGLFIYKESRAKQKANIELTHQKQIIEEKNKNIIDSIDYALLIQRAMLPHRKDIWNTFPNSFILFKPKDIVSGDFYFFAPIVQTPGNESCFIAAVDCTGHGVPGALMSMLCYEKLNTAITSHTDTSEILNSVNKGIKTSLRQSENKKSTRDGMDIALVRANKTPAGTLMLCFAGANRPIWIIRKGASTIEEIKSSRKSIGGFTDDNQHFGSHTMELFPGDTFYIFSDGYTDMLSENNEKLMTGRFRELLLSIQDKPMKEQGKFLESYASKWQGAKEQIDDILMIGIRV